MAARAQGSLTFAVRGPISAGDLAGLCDRVCALLTEARPTSAVCDVRGVEPTAATVDALARLQLAAKRFGCQVRLSGTSEDLRDLVAFMGLEDVLPE